MTRNEIIKELRCLASREDGEDCPSEKCDNTCPYWTEIERGAALYDDRQLCRAAADLLEQDAPGWISVKDRLPETSGYYLVCTLTAFYHTQCISKVYFSGSIWGSIRKRYTNVTHWMSLPEPPEEEK